MLFAAFIVTKSLFDQRRLQHLFIDDPSSFRTHRRLAGDNGPARVVPYAAEAGQFQEAGFSTVICGPGSIDQAHQADEYVDRAQMERGAVFMARLIDWAARGE